MKDHITIENIKNGLSGLLDDCAAIEDQELRSEVRLAIAKAGGAVSQVIHKMFVLRTLKEG